MRRAVTSLLAAAAFTASLGAAVPAVARECEGYGCAHENYERTRHLPAYGSRYDGYWDRRGEARGRTAGRDRRPGEGHGAGVRYYPGYGYYGTGGDWQDGHHGDAAAGCSRRHGPRGDRAHPHCG